MNVQSFLDTIAQSFVPSNTNVSVMKRTIELGFEGKVKDTDARKFFPFSEGDAVATRMEAAAWVRENGGEDTDYNPYPAIRVFEHKGTSLTHERAEDREYIIRGWKFPVKGDPTAFWRYTPRFDLMLHSLTGLESAWGYEVTAQYTEEMFGKPMWVAFARKPDLSFDKDNPETWDDYNSYEVVDENGETEKRQSFIDYVSGAFPTENEARAWMEENGYKITGDLGDKESTGVEIEMPESFASEGEWSGTGDLENTWNDIKDGLVADLTPVLELKKADQIKKLKELSETWMISVPTLQVVLSQLAPF